jgi:hypothetical protein
MVEIIGRPNEPAQFLTTSNIALVRNLSEINSDPWHDRTYPGLEGGAYGTVTRLSRRGWIFRGIPEVGSS